MRPNSVARNGHSPIALDGADGPGMTVAAGEGSSSDQVGRPCAVSTAPSSSSDPAVAPSCSIVIGGSLPVRPSIPAVPAAGRHPLWRRGARDDRTTSGNDKILATTYVPERLPSQYLRRWRA